jgi:hypothetical protein
MMQAHTITVGYSDSEDRLWLRLSNTDEALQTWLHRRFVQYLLPQVWELLSRTCHNPLAEFSGIHASSFNTNNQTLWLLAEREAALDYKATAPKNNKENSTHNTPELSLEPAGLIATINLSANTQRVEWSFATTRRNIGLNTSRAEAHQLLQMLFTRQHDAGWGLTAPWEMHQISED